MPLPPMKRFDQAPERSVIMAIAQKVQEAPIIWPIQAKYRLNPNLRG